MSSNEDTNTKIISTNNLRQSGVLSVGQANSVKLNRDLKKGLE